MSPSTGGSTTLETWVARARDGDEAALRQVVLGIQDRIYNLALRMLAHPHDAQDATQEIIIRVVTRLSSFSGDSAFTTWVYRVASNHLIDLLRTRNGGSPELSFDDYRADLESDLQEPGALTRDPEYQRLLNEMRIGCTMAMLLCLDSNHRLAFILGDVFELDHREASDILEITPAAYRKRLSRARERVVAFMDGTCGNVTGKATCTCPRKLNGAIRRGRVRPDALGLAPQAEETFVRLRTRLAETRDDLKALTLQRAVPRLASPTDFADEMAKLVRLAPN